MEKTALLVVDMLTDFFIPKPGLPAAVKMEKLLKNNQRAVRKAREKRVPVIFVNDSFQKTEIPIDRHFKISGPHAIIGTKEAEVVKELEYDENRDFIVPKKLYDGFYNTRLDSILRELGIKKCVVTGTWTHACVQHTVMSTHLFLPPPSSDEQKDGEIRLVGVMRAATRLGLFGDPPDLFRAFAG